MKFSKKIRVFMLTYRKNWNTIKKCKLKLWAHGFAIKPSQWTCDFALFPAKRVRSVWRKPTKKSGKFFCSLKCRKHGSTFGYTHKKFRTWKSRNKTLLQNTRNWRVSQLSYIEPRARPTNSSHIWQCSCIVTQMGHFSKLAFIFPLQSVLLIG